LALYFVLTFVFGLKRPIKQNNGELITYNVFEVGWECE